MNRLRITCLTLMVFVLLVGPLRAPAGDRAAERTLFTGSAYIEHVKYLASNELGGRGVDTAGIDKAAEYIAHKFELYGLRPAGEKGTWYQEFEVSQAKKLVDADASLKVDGLAGTWTLHEDWVPMPFGKLGDVEGELAFAGYGISAPEENYDDYGDFDAKGKVLLILRYEPKSPDPKATFGGDDPSRHSLFVTKARIAADKGAKALLIVDVPGRGESSSGELYRFDKSMAGQSYDLPMFSISVKLANALLQRGGLPDVPALAGEIDHARKGRAQSLKGLAVQIKSGLHYLTGRNVIGLLPGDGSTDEIIIVGAHYDHLGTVPRMSRRKSSLGDEIHNGADDNASGTAGMIELARVFGELRLTRRNILFMAFSAEEIGLLGSKHLVNNPTIDLSRARAMVNLDMIGRLSQNDFVIYGAPSGEGLEDIARRACEAANVPCNLPTSLQGMFDRSDHASFYAKQIPVLFPFTGVHKQYHMPEDDWERIDADGAARVTTFMYEVVRELANLEDGPVFVDPKKKKTEESAVAGDAPKADSPDAAAANPHAVADPKSDSDAPKMPRVRMGVMPSYSDDKEGLLVEDVSPDGAAQKGGIRGGDRIVQIGSNTIRNVYGYMDALQSFKAGDEVDVVVIRQGERLTLKVKLEAPPRRPEN